MIWNLEADTTVSNDLDDNADARFSDDIRMLDESEIKDKYKLISDLNYNIAKSAITSV